MIKSKNSAKAIIVNHNQVLMQRKEYPGGKIIFTLPGGTQEPGEALNQTVVREVLEETAAQVTCLGLAYVYEHSRPSKETPNTTKHKIEFAFVCELTADYTPQNGPYPDPHQVAIEWIDLDKLMSLELYPPLLQEVIPNALKQPLNSYLEQ